MTKGIGLLLFGMVIAVGCGGRRRASTPPSVGGSSNASVTRAAGPAVARAGEPGGALMGTGTAADPFLLCHMNGGAGRTDYAFVANWHCSDGSMPLGGIEERGAAARVGNVGDGPDGHIVDLYRISCPSGPVDLYVDGYHCGAVSTEVDVYHLSREQLGRMAQLIRTLHAHPEEFERRRDLMIWVIETPQVHVTLCDGPAGLVARDEAHPYLPELMLGLAASIIEDGRLPADAVQVYTDGLRGVAVYYQALVARDPSARHPTMDALVALMVSGALRAEVARRLTGCGTEGMGVDPSVR